MYYLMFGFQNSYSTAGWFSNIVGKSHILRRHLKYHLFILSPQRTHLLVNKKLVLSSLLIFSIRGGDKGINNLKSRIYVCAVHDGGKNMRRIYQGDYFLKVVARKVPKHLHCWLVCPVVPLWIFGEPHLDSHTSSLFLCLDNFNSITTIYHSLALSMWFQYIGLSLCVCFNTSFSSIHFVKFWNTIIQKGYIIDICMILSALKFNAIYKASTVEPIFVCFSNFETYSWYWNVFIWHQAILFTSICWKVDWYVTHML